MVLRRQPHASVRRGLGATDDGPQLPVATEVAGVNMRLTPGGVREMHWHSAAEWAYMLKGLARITAIDQEGRAFQDDVGEGDLWYFPAGIPHSIQGLGDEGCEFLLVFDDGNFSEEETFLLSDWLAHTPKDVLAKNFGVPESALGHKDIPRERPVRLLGRQPDPSPAVKPCIQRVAAGTQQCQRARQEKQNGEQAQPRIHLRP
jgi:oxalate decarboxylase